MWAGAKYAVTENLDVIGGYYHYIQNLLWHGRRGPLLLRHRTPAMRRDVRRDLCRCRLAVCTKVGSLFRVMFTQVNGGLAFGFLQRNNIAPTVGLRFRF